MANRTREGSTTRRSFVQLSGAAALLAGSAELNKPWAQTARSLARNWPDLDGQLLFDDGVRQANAVDNGRHVRRLPLAVLRPRSVDDVVRMVAHANRHGLKIAMRGQGHSQYGQSQVEDGIVIESSTLNALRWDGSDAVDAEPGVLWGEVAKATLAQGRIPPVMPDAMMLTVGGTLSIGGIGETTYRYGAQVDNVLELEIVTGAGELVTCSPERNSELFAMTLAGVGQCGIILRARLRLVPASKMVAIRTLVYDDMDSFLTDQARLAAADTLGPLNGRAIREQDGRTRFHLFAGSFVDTAQEAGRPPSWMSGPRFNSEQPMTTIPHWNYLDRRTANVTAQRTRGFTNASLVASLPDDAVRPFVAHVLSTPEAFSGIWTFEISVKIPARHTRPLQKMPAAPVAYELRMQRRTAVTDDAVLKSMLTANHSLLARVLASGGAIYPAYCPILSREQWQVHFGADTWKRFAAAKKRFDPNNVLTPGAGIF